MTSLAASNLVAVCAASFLVMAEEHNLIAFFWNFHLNRCVRSVWVNNSVWLSASMDRELVMAWESSEERWDV